MLYEFLKWERTCGTLCICRRVKKQLTKKFANFVTTILAEIELLFFLIYTNSFYATKKISLSIMYLNIEKFL